MPRLCLVWSGLYLNALPFASLPYPLHVNITPVISQTIQTRVSRDLFEAFCEHNCEAFFLCGNRIL